MKETKVFRFNKNNLFNADSLDEGLARLKYQISICKEIKYLDERCSTFNTILWMSNYSEFIDFRELQDFLLNAGLEVEDFQEFIERQEKEYKGRGQKIETNSPFNYSWYWKAKKEAMDGTEPTR